MLDIELCTAVQVARQPTAVLTNLVRFSWRVACPSTETAEPLRRNFFSSGLFGFVVLFLFVFNFSFILEIWSYPPLLIFPSNCFHIPHEESLCVLEISEIMYGNVCIHLMRSLENKDI